MPINIRSLGFRLSSWYALFTIVWMVCWGTSSYLYLREALASSRQRTMIKREHRLLKYMQDEDLWGAPGSLHRQFHHFLEATAETEIIQVFSLDGTRLYPRPGKPARKIVWKGTDCRHVCFGLVHFHGHIMRTLNHVTRLGGRRVRLCMAGEEDEHYNILKTLMNSYFFSAPFLLLACIAGGYALSRRALYPLDRIMRDTRKLGIRNLGQRLAVPPTGDELQCLAETWNDLLARLDSSVDKITQFTSDISHDLRTTMTVMLATTHFALRKDRSAEEYRDALQTIALECQGTSDLLNDLLAASRSDISEHSIDHHPVNLSDVVGEICELMKAQSEMKCQKLSWMIVDDAWAVGDLPHLRRLFVILLDNAIKYTPEHGKITATVSVREAEVLVEVADTGIGIAPENVDRVFDRFFRADQTRNRDNGGSGLGLSIAKWIADAHASTIRITSRPGSGTVFTVCFPRMSVPSQQPRNVELV